MMVIPQRSLRLSQCSCSGAAGAARKRGVKSEYLGIGNRAYHLLRITLIQWDAEVLALNRLENSLGPVKTKIRSAGWSRRLRPIFRPVRSRGLRVLLQLLF